MQKEVRLIAPFHNNSGYGKAGKGLLAALLTQGYAVEAIESEANVRRTLYADGTMETTRTPFRPKPMHPAQQQELDAALATKVSPDAPTILLGTPDILNAYPEYPDKRIGFTMWEVNQLPKRWTRRMRNVERIVTPSRWNAGQVKNNAVSMVPLCVDERFWSAEGNLFPVADTWRPDFLFLSVFYVSERKNWQEMVAAFAEEFWGENVGLIIRAGGEWQYLKETCDFYNRIGVNITVLTEELTEEELAGLYRLADCFVLPSTEGFGMPYVEAALCGTPSIGLAGQAGGETVRAVGGLVTESCVAQSFSRIPHLYSPQMTHMKPKHNHLRDAMRCMVDTRDDVLVADSKAFSRERIGAQLAAVIEEVRAAETVILETEETPPCAVVMLTRNHLDKTQLAIESLKRTSPQAKILVVDDGSEDGTQEWLRSEGVAVMESPTRNIAKNWNAGVERLLAEGHEGVIVFSDNDVEYQDGWLEAMWRVMASDPAIGIVAPAKWKPVPDAEGEHTLQNCGNWLSDKCEGADNFMLREIYEADYVETACLMARGEVWKTVRMDERFPIFYNDVDYCFEARKTGYRSVATRLANVLHTPHTTSDERRAEVAPLRNAFIRKWKETLRG